MKRFTLLYTLALMVVVGPVFAQNISPTPWEGEYVSIYEVPQGSRMLEDIAVLTGAQGFMDYTDDGVAELITTSKNNGGRVTAMHVFDGSTSELVFSFIIEGKCTDTDEIQECDEAGFRFHGFIPGDFTHLNTPENLMLFTINGSPFIYCPVGLVFTQLLASQWQLRGIRDFDGDRLPEFILEDVNTGIHYVHGNILVWGSRT